MPCRKLSALSTGVAVSSLRQLSDGTGTSTLSPICIKQPVLSWPCPSSVLMSKHLGIFSDGKLLPVGSSTTVGGFSQHAHDLLSMAPSHARWSPWLPLRSAVLDKALSGRWQQPGVSFCLNWVQVVPIGLLRTETTSIPIAHQICGF